MAGRIRRPLELEVEDSMEGSIDLSPPPYRILTDTCRQVLALLQQQCVCVNGRACPGVSMSMIRRSVRESPEQRGRSLGLKPMLKDLEKKGLVRLEYGFGELVWHWRGMGAPLESRRPPSDGRPRSTSKTEQISLFKEITDESSL